MPSKRTQWPCRWRIEFWSTVFEIVETWGVEQCARYVEALERACERLVENPTLGRVYPLRPRYLRYEEGSHVIFFRRDTDGDVLVVRFLHERQLPVLHLGDDDQ